MRLRSKLSSSYHSMKTLTVVPVILVFAVLLLHDVRGVSGSGTSNSGTVTKTTPIKPVKFRTPVIKISNDTWFTNQTLHKRCVWLSRNEICPE